MLGFESVLSRGVRIAVLIIECSGFRLPGRFRLRQLLRMHAGEHSRCLFGYRSVLPGCRAELLKFSRFLLEFKQFK